MNVLVLCHGNINRSPFVAAIIARHRPGWTVRSAGLKTYRNRIATRKAKFAAHALGLSLREHRSTPVDGLMIDAADVVLYMDGGNARRLRALLLEEYTSAHDQKIWDEKCRLLASYGSLRRLRDPNYTSDPVELAKMFKEAELCTMKFLEAHSA